MNNEIQLIEELSLNANPSLNTLYYDGWYLRFAENFTSRANSVNILNPSTLPIADKIRHCEKIYTQQNQPTIFKITPISLELDYLLN